jgi:hypothetical protein
MIHLSELDKSRSRVRLALCALKIRRDIMAAERRMQSCKGNNWRAQIARALYELERKEGNV